MLEGLNLSWIVLGLFYTFEVVLVVQVECGCSACLKLCSVVKHVWLLRLFQVVLC